METDEWLDMVITMTQEKFIEYPAKEKLYKRAVACSDEINQLSEKTGRHTKFITAFEKLKEWFPKGDLKAKKEVKQPNKVEKADRPEELVFTPTPTPTQETTETIKETTTDTTATPQNDFYRRIPMYIVNCLSELSGAEVKVCLAIAKYMNKDWSLGCYPSQETIADVCGVDRKTVNRAIVRLEQLKLIRIEKKKSGGFGVGGFAHNVYYWHYQ